MIQEYKESIMNIPKYIIEVTLNLKENAVEAKVFLRVDDNGQDRRWNYSSYPPENSFLSKIEAPGDKAYREAMEKAKNMAISYLTAKGYKNIEDFDFIY